MLGIYSQTFISNPPNEIFLFHDEFRENLNNSQTISFHLHHCQIVNPIVFHMTSPAEYVCIFLKAKPVLKMNENSMVCRLCSEYTQHQLFGHARRKKNVP